MPFPPISDKYRGIIHLTLLLGNAEGPTERRFYAPIPLSFRSSDILKYSRNNPRKAFEDAEMYAPERVEDWERIPSSEFDHSG